MSCLLAISQDSDQQFTPLLRGTCRHLSRERERERGGGGGEGEEREREGGGRGGGGGGVE